jgi:O-antigen/teichoic acid export membrane protein
VLNYFSLKFKKFQVSVVVRNAIANYMGNVLTALIAFIFIPVYIRYLGIGSYGVIGFFASLQTFLAFLDLGIGMAMNREMSRFYHDPSQADYLRRLSHSLQVVYWALGIVIGISLFLLSPFLAANWFTGNEMPTSTLYAAFSILALTMAVRWPYSLYSSGIRGMQHQVILNVHDISWAIIKNAGSWLVLKYYAADLGAFLWYQCIITFLQTAGTFAIIWYYMPRNKGSRNFIFDKQILKNISRYAAGMGGAFLLGSIIMQLDKILVSKMVKPSEFGYYMVAANVAILVYNASLPMYMAIFPHFAKLAHDKQEEQLKKDFHFYSKLLSTLMFPFSAVVFFAAEEALWLWTKDRELARTTAPILRIMIVGTTLNACITTVHTLLLAYNRIRIAFYSNLVACISMIPLTLLLVNMFGVKGGAVSVSILYACYFFVQVIMIFRNLGLQKLTMKWYISDILFILIPVAFAVFLSTHYWLSADTGWTKSVLVIKLSVIAIIAYVVSVISNDLLREKLVGKLFPGYIKSKTNNF